MQTWTWVFGVFSLVVLMAGCQPELARVNYGEEEQQWQEFVDQSYSGFKPPRTAAPAVSDKYSSETEGTTVEAEPGALSSENTDTNSDSTETAAPGNVSAESTDNAVPDKVVVKDGELVEAPAGEPAKETAPEKAPVFQNTTTYIVKPGDTLSYIAKKVYKDGRKYDLIIKANPSLRKNPNLVKPGMKLQIPQL